MKDYRTEIAKQFHVDPKLFDDTSIPPSIQQLNAQIEETSSHTPLLSTLDPTLVKNARAAQYKHDTRRTTLSIPGHRPNTDTDSTPPLKLALFRPTTKNVRGVYLHLHGGGWMIGSAFGQSDDRLQGYANDHGMAVVSVDYRLTPEWRWPAPLYDCVAAALWALGPGRVMFGSGGEENETKPVLVGGESSGAQLCVSTLLYLHHRNLLNTEADFRAVNLVYGFYDLEEGTPSRQAFHRRLVFTNEELSWFAQHLRPDNQNNKPIDNNNDDDEDEDVLLEDLLSPLHAKLPSDVLPPALFSVGTADALLDDTLLMAQSWEEARVNSKDDKSELVVMPGAAHGVGHFGPHEFTEQGSELNQRIGEFFERYLS